MNIVKFSSREEAISIIAKSLKEIPFVVEFKAVKRPRGIKIIYETTQEHLNSLTK